MSNLFIPETPLTSLLRSLNHYMRVGSPPNIAGLPEPLYDLVASYPAADDQLFKVPLPKTLIHYDFDLIHGRGLGFGDSVTFAEFDDANALITEHEARWYDVDVDIGIWASTESGGPTSRMEVREILDNLFAGSAAYHACFAVTTGVQITDLMGGTNITDSYNDVTIFRMVDISLRCTVFGRRVLSPYSYIEGIEQDPGLEIDDIVIVG